MGIVVKLQELTEEAKELEECSENEIGDDSSLPFKVGKAYFFRTVTYHLTGKVKAVKGNFLVLKEAAWIADSGRFSQAINDGTLDEVEPVKVNVMLNLSSITDAFEWKHPMPKDQK